MKCCHTYLFYYMCCYLKVKPMRRCVNGPPTQETFQDPDDLLPRRFFWRRRCVNGPPTQETSQDPDDLLPRTLFWRRRCVNGPPTQEAFPHPDLLPQPPKAFFWAHNSHTKAHREHYLLGSGARSLSCMAPPGAKDPQRKSTKVLLRIPAQQANCQRGP